MDVSSPAVSPRWHDQSQRRSASNGMRSPAFATKPGAGGRCLTASEIMARKVHSLDRSVHVVRESLCMCGCVCLWVSHGRTHMQARVRFKTLLDPPLSGSHDSASVDRSKQSPFRQSPGKHAVFHRGFGVASVMSSRLVHPLLHSTGDGTTMSPLPGNISVAIIDDVGLEALGVAHDADGMSSGFGSHLGLGAAGGVDATARAEGVQEAASLLRSLFDHGLVLDTAHDRWRMAVRASPRSEYARCMCTESAGCVTRLVFVCVCVCVWGGTGIRAGCPAHCPMPQRSVLRGAWSRARRCQAHPSPRAPRDSAVRG